MSGLLHDQGAMDGVDDLNRTSDVDIDPSFPEQIRQFSLFNDDLLGPPELTADNWITSGKQVDMTPYLKVAKVGADNGPWITLDGFVVQEDENRGRRSFCFVRTFIVKKAISTRFSELLARQDLSGRWLPEKPSAIYAFSGEIPWSTTYPENGATEFSFIKSQQIVKRQKTGPAFYLDGRKLPFSETDLLRQKLLSWYSSNDDNGNGISSSDIERIEVREISFESEEIEQEFEKHEAIIPVCDFRWEGHHSVTNDAGRAVTLAKEIANELNLLNQPQGVDLFTKDGARGTLNISDHSKDFNNHQTFFLLKKDLLQSYLRENNSSLIWVIWGEREYSSKKIGTLWDDSNPPQQTHGKIKEIIAYDESN